MKKNLSLKKIQLKLLYFKKLNFHKLGILSDYFYLIIKGKFHGKNKIG